MTNKTSWFSEEAGFFGPEYLSEYEETLPHERTISEVDFIETTLELQPNTVILDVPCGHGRHAVELAIRGHKVTGVDLNRFFLSKAKEQVEGGWAITQSRIPYQYTPDEVPVSIRFEQGDMREINFDCEFDVALNLFTAMGYFDTDEDDRKFMAGVYRALKPGGQFLIDYMNRNWLIRNFKAKDWRELPSGALLLIEREHDDIRGRNLGRRTKIKDGVVGETATTSLRIYTTNELVSMAESVGFTFKEAFGDFEGNSLELNSCRTILHFEKQ